MSYLYDEIYANTAIAKSLQSCPTLCDPIPGILQARTLEWVAISFSNAWKWKMKVKSLSHVLLFPTPWTAAYQTPLSMGFSRQEYWSRVPLTSPMQTLSFSKLPLSLGYSNHSLHPSYGCLISFHNHTNSGNCIFFSQLTTESYS